MRKINRVGEYGKINSDFFALYRIAGRFLAKDMTKAIKTCSSLLDYPLLIGLLSSMKNFLSISIYHPQTSSLNSSLKCDVVETSVDTFINQMTHILYGCVDSLFANRDFHALIILVPLHMKIWALCLKFKNSKFIFIQIQNPI